MSHSAEKLLEKALDLDERDRAMLAGLLLESLDMEVEEGVEAAWVAEIKRRMAELDTEPSAVVPWNDVKARLLQSMDATKKR